LDTECGEIGLSKDHAQNPMISMYHAREVIECDGECESHWENYLTLRHIYDLGGENTIRYEMPFISGELEGWQAFWDDTFWTTRAIVEIYWEP
jgi:hypothetical protein